MAQWWKLGREIQRLGKQVRSIAGLVAARFRRISYDRSGRQTARETAGNQPLRPDLAILLIYQPDGLLPSTLWQLDQLIQRGVTPIVVCNHPLREADREQLQPLTHLILERPNVGYDFGGYRDGVLLVLDRGFAPERLFVLNDSVWFPLNADCTLIDDARAAPADLFGIYYNTKARQKRRHHLQSYFYRFNTTVLRDPRFGHFWRTMPLYRDKLHVIRECEVKLAGTFHAMGYNIDALVLPQDVTAAADRLTDTEFADVARFYATTSLRGRSIFGDMVDMSPDDPRWSEARRCATHDSRLKYYFIDAEPLILLRELRAPFLKKGREYLYYRQRNRLIDLNLHSHLDPVVAKEVTSWNAQKTALPPQSPDFPPL